jgi:hypothetical protein
MCRTILQVKDGVNVLKIAIDFHHRLRQNPTSALGLTPADLWSSSQRLMFKSSAANVNTPSSL